MYHRKRNGDIKMKETIYTIPLNDAFQANDECPFCYLEREAERHAINFILGSAASYMEDDIRMETDKLGFCRHHYKMMYDYGNRLGCGLMLSTHLKKLNEEMTEQMKRYTSTKVSLLDRIRKPAPDPDKPESELGKWIQRKEKTCYVCNHFDSNYNRYLENFFYMYNESGEFRNLFKNSKGFCLHHFKDLLEAGERQLKEKEKSEFYSILFELMQTNMKRLEDEVTWFCDKQDYKNKDKDWGNSKDSIQRAMQKLGGGYPADDVFKLDF